VNCISLEWFTSRTIGELYIIRDAKSVYTSRRPVRLVQVVQVMKQWLTSRTVGELCIIRDYKSVYTSPRPVRLLRVVQLYIQCILIGVPKTGEFKALIKMYIPRSKRDCPRAQNTIDILRYTSVRIQKRYIQCLLFGVLEQESRKALVRIRSHNRGRRP